MALLHVSMPPQCLFLHNLPRNLQCQRSPQGNHRTGHFRYLATASTQNSQTGRRSAKFQPNIWTHDFVKSLKNDHADEIFKERAKKLEEEVRNIIDDKGASPLTLLELIDDIERLGVGHRFEKDINGTLHKMLSLEGLNVRVGRSLHHTALRFRLLRQHGYQTSEETFRSFKDHKGGFMAWLQKDVQGLLSLYEASFLAIKGETLLDEAKSFSRIHLKELKGHKGISLIEEVYHALELPLHRRMLRLEARWYIDEYGKRKDGNRLLLELATLDFNMMQSTLQKDLQVVSRWWNNIGLASKLSFIRDRLMESFCWTVGMVPKPQFSKCRIGLTKMVTLITAIDDIYDVYGSLAELQLFTDAVERWDIDAVKHLPDYMKLCFLALYNSVNEIAYDILKEHGENIIPILTKAWADLCQAFLVEAKWSYKKYTPTIDAYLDNGWRSVSGVVLLVHSYFLTTENITKDSIEYLEKSQDLLRCSSMVFRLCNDLATSAAELESGETANSILCYMRERGVSEEVAREHISNLIDEAWKMINKDLDQTIDSPFAKTFIETAINLARTSQCIYQYGDGHGAPDIRSRNRVLSLIIEPITLMDSRIGQLC